VRKSIAGRDAFVLPVVIFTIVIMGVIAVAALRTSDDGRRASAAMRAAGGAFYAAESGVYRVLGEWTDTTNTLDSSVQALADGDSLMLPPDTLANGASYVPKIFRLSGGTQPMYLLTVTGNGAGSRGGKRLLSLVLTSSIDVSDFASASVALGGGTTELVSDPTTTINGNDTPPAGWDCPPPGPSLPGVASDVTQTQGSGTILGDPPILLDPTIDASTFTEFGGVTYAEMVAMADKVYAPGASPDPSPSVTGTNCNTGVQDNWGDPLNPNAPCGDYFPIIHFQGDVEFNDTGSVGQGILLVDGNFAVGGGDFAFYGLIMIQGKCVFEYGSSVYGAVLCATGGGEIGDDAAINYSSCALADALTQAGVTQAYGPVVEPLGSRAWSEF